jgi:ribosomal protein S27E
MFLASYKLSVIERSYEAFLTEKHTQIAALSTTAQEVDCPGCNAQFAFEPPHIAGQCPFCSTSIVAQPHAANPITIPESLLPFQVDRRTAKENVQRWLRRRWFAPTGLSKLT